MRSHRLQLGLGALALFVGVAPAALAQTTPPSAPGAGSSDQAIIVTATREKTNVQKTAVQVTPLSAQKLTDSAANQMRDITYLAPSVRYTSGTGSAAGTSISIRGVGTSAAGGAGPGALVYFEEVPQGAMIQNTSPYDLNDVQVLQGPQGTLFGRNTLAGAILVEPVLPSYSQNGYLKAGYGSYNYWTLEGAANLTIVPDVLAARFSGQIQRRDGYIQSLSPNLGPQASLGTDSFRASVLFTPTSNFKNVFTFDYFHENDTGIPSVQGDPVNGIFGLNGPAGLLAIEASAPFLVGPGPMQFPTLTAAQNFIAQSLGYQSYADGLAANQAEASCHHRCIDFGKLNNNDLFTHADHYHVYDTATWDVTPNVTLKNIIGFQYDNDSVGVNVFGDVTDAFLGFEDTPTRTLTEEFQVQAHGFNDRVHGVLGVFYDNNWNEGPSGELLPNAGIAVSSAAKANSEAIYGDVTFDITSKLKIHGGYRYTWDYQTRCSQPSLALLTANQCFANGAINPLQINSKSSSAPTWSFGLDYQATPDLFFYVVSRRGYRAAPVNANYSGCLAGAPSIYNSANPTPGVASPGFTCINDLGVQATFPFGSTPTALQQQAAATGRSIDLTSFDALQAETLTDVEVGMRSDWHVGDWRGRFNLTYYHYEDVNVAVAVVLGQPAVLPGQLNFLGAGNTQPNDELYANQTSNGGISASLGKVTANGVQGDLTIMPTSDLSVDFNFSYLNQVGAPFALPAAFSSAGLSSAQQAAIHAQLFPQITSPTPPWAYSIALRYALPWRPLGGQVVLNYNYFWTQGWYDVGVAEPGYDLHNIRIDWNNIGGSKINMGVWVRNLFDRDYILAAPYAPEGAFTYGEPRMVGFDVTAKFH